MTNTETQQVTTSDYHLNATTPKIDSGKSTLTAVNVPVKTTSPFDKASDSAVPPPTANRFAKMLRVLMFFALWFMFSVAYNIFNKDAMNMIKLPWLIAAFQMGCGIPLFTSLWLTKVRKAPSMSLAEFVKIFPLCLFHCGTHISAVLALSAGSVSFAHIIKSGEPIVTSFLSFVLLAELYNWKVYMALTPVISGVALASISEPQFSLFAFLTAMGSNVFSALRSVYSKKKMSNPVGTNVDARNLYGILTIVSFLILTPIAFAVEGSKMVRLWEESRVDHSASAMIINIILSGLCYYTYNEVAFSTLELVSPVTHAVGSTFKRVFIIFGSILKYGNYPAPIGYVGITIAIAGVGVYSLAKQKYKLSPKIKAAVDPKKDDIAQA